MIEFSGYLSGLAEKYFQKKSMILGRNALLVGVLMLLPVIVRLGIKISSWQIIVVYCSLFIVIPLLAMIPKRKKERRATTPKKIFVEDGYIVCIADRYTESRLLSDAKLLRDFGEFYEIVFPFGKVSDKFICQKNLIVKGTTEEFEALFAGKVIRKGDKGTVLRLEKRPFPKTE